MLKLELLLLSMLMLPLMSNVYNWLVMLIMVFTTLVACFILFNNGQYMFMTEYTAMDSMSYALIILTLWVTSMMMLASTKIFFFKTNHKMFSMNIIILLIILINCFSAPNMFIFYIWFEASLIPTMVLIMCWGYQPERSQASMYLMIYTVTASLPMLAALCKIYWTSKTSLMPMFMNMNFPTDYSSIMVAWVLTLAGFMVKLPLFTVHLWLPKAHVEAPIAGSMILAAILLKLGGYGLLRMLSLFQYTSKSTSSMLMSVALTGAVSTSLICMRQSDLKSLIAYSSVGHMGLMIGAATLNTNWGMQASLAMMIAHGLSSSALFVMANINYEMTKTRSMYLTKGLMVVMPIMTMWWFMFTASNMAAPPSINLLSEIMLITSIVSSSMMSLLPVMLLSFFTAAYSLYLYTSMHHGAMNTYSNPLPQIKVKDYILMLMHMVPIIILIVKPELITSWN